MAANTPRTIKLTGAGDFDVSTGNLVILAGTDAIAQSIRTRLQFFKGEWFLDLDAGVPYFTDVLVKAPNPDAVQTVFRNAILETPGVLAITSLVLTFDRATRSLSVSFSVTTDVGELGPAEVIL